MNVIAIAFCAGAGATINRDDPAFIWEVIPGIMATALVRAVRSQIGAEPGAEVRVHLETAESCLREGLVGSGDRRQLELAATSAGLAMLTARQGGEALEILHQLFLDAM